MKCIPPYTPLLYSKTGVCRGIPIFCIFDPKHRLWVLVRITKVALMCTHNLCLSKSKKNMKSFLVKISIFTTKTFPCIAWAYFRNVSHHLPSCGNTWYTFIPVFLPAIKHEVNEKNNRKRRTIQNYTHLDIIWKLYNSLTVDFCFNDK